MRFDVFVHFVNEDGIHAKLDQILNAEVQVAGELAALQVEVAENKSVMESAVLLLQGLKAALDAAGTDPAALAALSAELDANTNALAAAVTTNTPTPPTP